MPQTDHSDITASTAAPSAHLMTEIPGSGAAAAGFDIPESLLDAILAAMEAEDAERELAKALGPCARAQVALDREGRLAAVDMIRSRGGDNGDKSIDRILAVAWDADHVRRYGPAPAARTVRRWLRIHRETGAVPVRPFAPNTVEASGGGFAAPVAKLAPGREDARVSGVAAMRMAAPGSKDPAIDDLIEIDGVRLRCVGRTAPGRTRLAEVDVRAGARAAVRSLEPGERFTAVTVH